MAFDTFLAVAPLSHQHLIKTPDPSRQHQGVAGEAEPVGFGVGSFGGRGERRERIAPRAARVTSVSPLHRERRDRRLRQRTRTKVVTGNRVFARGKMIRARVVRKLRMVSRRFMIYDL